MEKNDFNKKLESFIKSAKKATQKAANKTMELADIASLNVKLQGLKVKLSEKFEELGKLSYQKLSGIGEISTDEVTETEADTTVDKIAGLVEQIDKLYEEISCLKSEIKSRKATKKPEDKSEEEAETEEND